MAFSSPVSYSSSSSSLPNPTTTTTSSSNNNNIKKKKKKPESAAPKTRFTWSGSALVCRCYYCWQWSTLFFLLFLSISSSYFLTFCAASNPKPTSYTTTINKPITATSISSPSPSPSPTIIYTVKGTTIDTPTNNNNNPHLNRRRRILIITLIIFASILTCLLFMTMSFLKFLKFKLIKRRSRRVEDVQDHHHHQSDSPNSICNTSTKLHQDISGSKINKMFINNNNNPLINCSTTSSTVPCRFTWEEIERLTMNFSSRVIGEGGFSTIYLSHFSDSTLGALKIHGGNSERLNRMFKQELEVLLHIQHQNIVNLLGYCDEKEETGALVFEYIPNGTLHDKLHHGSDFDCNKEVLSWKSRMSIAFQLAQAIEYLHEDCKPQIVHGDIKSSNILLDNQLNPKLCDFGFSKMGFSSTVIKSSMNPLMGSPGYMDPLYLRTGIASKKNDVYSFGVIILELITGIEAFCSKKEQLLTSIAGPIIRDAQKVAEMVDPRLSVLGDIEIMEEAKIMATISAQCLRQQSMLRPSMSEILNTMREKIISF